MIQIKPNDGIFAFERWSESEKAALHNTSMRILEEVGVHVFNAEAMELLKKAGASIDGNLVKIDRKLVEQALESAPSVYSLYNTDGEEVIVFETNNVYYGTGTDMPEFIDLYSGEIREARLEDCENAAKVADQCKYIDWIAPYALSNDKNPRVSDMYHFKAMRKYSKKPNLTLATDAYSLKGVIDMAAAQAGGYDALREKPTFVHYAEPVSPLQNSDEALAKLLLCAEYGVPVTYTSGIMAGATGPVTLAGTLAVGNAECLAGLVVHQLKCKGAPFMFGIESSIMDMKTTVCMYGGPEYGLMNSFVGEMARYYKLPSFGISGATDSNHYDFQMGAEMLYTMMCSIYGRQNFVHDNGYMGLGQMGALQAIIASNELLGFTARYVQGIEFTEENLAFDSIKAVGQGGNFLERRETFKKFRKEFYQPEFLNRMRHMGKPSPSIPEKFTAKAKSIIEGECPVYISDELEAEFDRLIKEHEDFYGID